MTGRQLTRVLIVTTDQILQTRDERFIVKIRELQEYGSVPSTMIYEDEHR